MPRSDQSPLSESCDAGSRALEDPLSSILRFGDPRLATFCDQVGAWTGELAPVAEQMFRTIHAHRLRHGWGRAIAAPQIGVSKRLVCLSLDSRETVMLDPKIVWMSEARQALWDDCMSLPEIAVRVLRHESVTVTYRDPNGNKQAFERVTFDLAELLQHEIDHLDSVLMTDRMVSLRGCASVIARENRAYFCA